MFKLKGSWNYWFVEHFGDKNDKKKCDGYDFLEPKLLHSNCLSNATRNFQPTY